MGCPSKRLQSGNVLQLHADVKLFVEAGHLVFFREATEQCVHRLHLHSLEYVLFCRVSQRRRSELLRVQLSVALSISHASIALAALLVASVFAEPEAEADPNAWYDSYGYSGFPYYGYGAGLAYAGAYAPYTYAGYPYAYGYNGYALGGTHLIGKRSADAEAKPEAWYGAYGYGYAT